jgi:hypothetical protein
MGAGNSNNYISIAEKGTDDNTYVNRTYTGSGSPLSIRTPTRPGQYELRYVMAQSDRVTARKPLVVLPLQAPSVFAPSTPGTYELRYVWAEEDSVLTRKPLTVTQK